MNNQESYFSISLQCKLAKACKENDLQDFKKILFSSDFAHYDKNQLGNIAFLAAYMDANDAFISYLILDYKIEKTSLVNKFLNENMRKLFKDRDVFIQK